MGTALVGSLDLARSQSQILREICKRLLLSASPVEIKVSGYLTPILGATRRRIDIDREESFAEQSLVATRFAFVGRERGLGRASPAAIETA